MVSEQVHILDAKRAESRRIGNRFTTGTLFKICVQVLLWAYIGNLMSSLQHVRDVVTFDPFEILEVSRDATKDEIKKAYSFFHA